MEHRRVVDGAVVGDNGSAGGHRPVAAERAVFGAVRWSAADSVSDRFWPVRRLFVRGLSLRVPGSAGADVVIGGVDSDLGVCGFVVGGHDGLCGAVVAID